VRYAGGDENHVPGPDLVFFAADPDPGVPG